MLIFKKHNIMLPPTSYNIILFELDFDIRFPLLHLLKFLGDLKNNTYSWFKKMCQKSGPELPTS